MSKRIQVNDLDVYYGQFKAVEGVNMVIEPRSVTAFIGPSGCGKSTFLRTLNRMHEVIPGARVDGEVLVDVSREALEGTRDHFRKMIPPMFARWAEATDDVAELGVYGPRSRALLASVLGADLPELAAVSDRVVVLREGRVVAELTGDDVTEPVILHHCYGGEAAVAST